MSDSPALGGLHTLGDLETADDFAKKHTPYLAATREGDSVTLTVEVGHYVSHPNTADHWIDSIELRVEGAPIASFHFAAAAVAPSVVTIALLDAGTRVQAIGRCNLHGSWAAEITV